MNDNFTVILGAGPAGMACGFELNKSQKNFIILEKENQIGGMSKTLQFGDFKTDIGPHRFYSQNQYLYDMIKDLLGNKWIKVNRLTRFYIKGKFFLYPVDVKDALSKVGLIYGSKIVFDYVLEKIKKKIKKKKIISFEDQVISDFGRSLAELNMLNYTEKIWGLPCSKISPDWSKQRIKGLSLTEVIKKSLFKSKKGGPKTLVDQFYYPEDGTGLIYEKMKERILKNNFGSIKLNTYPIKIIHDDKKINKIITNNGDLIETSYLVSTIPITKFIEILEPNVPKKISNAAKKLRFRSHVSLFVTINKSRVFPDQWIYFPDKEIPFARITEPKNFSKKMSPPRKTSLLIEFFCWENDKIWNSSKEDLFELSLDWLENLDFIKRNDVIDLFLHKQKFAYPVYDLKYRKNIEKIKKYFNNFINLQLIGRLGAFKYNNQDHALEMGILAARNIIEGKKYDIDEIGSKQEYFEKGYIK
ncbi:MAG: FAD-dependent oxidoreductase [Candidatus Aenigmatarchaeota archaeon]